MLKKPIDASINKDGIDTNDQDIWNDADYFVDDSQDIPDDIQIDIPYEISLDCLNMAEVEVDCSGSEGRCKNGTVNCGEKCDDGDDENADGCDPACLFETKVCTLAKFGSAPADIAFYENTAFISDSGDHTIKKFDLDTGNIEIVAGYPGQHGFSDSPGTQARFNTPRGLEIIGKYLIIADMGNNRIRKLDLLSNNYEVSTIAGNGTGISSDAFCLSASFNKPWGIASDGEFIYISDSGSGEIRKISNPFNGDCDVVTLNHVENPKYFLSHPAGMVYDSVRYRLLVADYGKHVIVKITKNSDIDYEFVVFAGIDGTTGGILTGECRGVVFNEPIDIAFNGKVFIVAEKGRSLIREIIDDVSCNVSILAGNVSILAGRINTPGCSDSNISGDRVSLNNPSCVFFNTGESLGVYRAFFCDVCNGVGAIRLVK